MRLTEPGRSEAMSRYKLCEDCGQPMLPKGETKRPNEYDHASGCPRAPRSELAERIIGAVLGMNVKIPAEDREATLSAISRALAEHDAQPAEAGRELVEAVARTLADIEEEFLLIPASAASTERALLLWHGRLTAALAAYREVAK